MKFSTKPCRVIQPYSYPRTVLNTHKLNHNKKTANILNVTWTKVHREFSILYSNRVAFKLTENCLRTYKQYKHNISISKL